MTLDPTKEAPDGVKLMALVKEVMAYEKVNFTDLKRKAEAATQGEWTPYPYNGEPGWGILTRDPLPVLIAKNVMHDHDCIYIAAMNPATALALLARIEELERDYAALKHDSFQQELASFREYLKPSAAPEGDGNG